MSNKPVLRKSAKYKMGIVLKAIGGESIEALSREYKVGVTEIEKWKSQFLNGGLAYLNIRTDTPEGKKIVEAQTTIGKMAMEIEILKKKTGLI